MKRLALLLLLVLAGCGGTQVVIEMLALRARYGILPAQHDVIATGPNFVTRDNAEQALELSERSIR